MHRQQKGKIAVRSRSGRWAVTERSQSGLLQKTRLTGYCRASFVPILTGHYCSDIFIMRVHIILVRDAFCILWYLSVAFGSLFCCCLPLIFYFLESFHWFWISKMVCFEYKCNLYVAQSVVLDSKNGLFWPFFEKSRKIIWRSRKKPLSLHPLKRKSASWSVLVTIFEVMKLTIKFSKYILG